MTKLHIERKSPSTWPWVLGLVALLLIIIWAVARTNDEPGYTSTGDVAAPVVVPVPPPTVPLPLVLVETRRFVEFADQPPDFGDLNTAHTYTRNGLHYLAGALHEIAGDSSTLAAKIAALREAAGALGNERGVEHAKVFSVVAGQAADAIEQLQRDRFPSLGAEAQAVRRAAGELDSAAPLLSQKDRVQSFFKAASGAVQRMGASAPPSRTTGGTR